VDRIRSPLLLRVLAPLVRKLLTAVAETLEAEPYP